MQLITLLLHPGHDNAHYCDIHCFMQRTGRCCLISGCCPAVVRYLAVKADKGSIASQITAMTHKSLLPDTTIGTGTLDLAQAAAQSGPVVVQLSGKTGASAGNVRPVVGTYCI